MAMDVIAGKRNRNSDTPGRHVGVSGVHTDGVYSRDVSRSGTFVAADERQFRTEATLSSEAEAQLLLVHGFQAGDMVWAKVKSHPWWPGYIFQESLCPSVHRTKSEGYVLVAFFGDNSYGWFDPAELLPFDPHFADKSLQSTSKIFLDAVKDAIDEVSRRGALGLSCCCHNPDNFCKASVPGYIVVDVLGYENSVVYSKSVVDKARENFVPADAMSFVSKLAVGPCEVDLQDVDAVKMVAILEAIRKAEHYRLIDKSVKVIGPVPTRQQSDPQGILQRSTLREPRGEPEVPSGHRSKKAAAAAPDDNRRPNQCLLKRRVDAPVPHSSAGASPTSYPRLAGAPAPKPLVPSSAATDQPSPQNAAQTLELPDAAPPVAGCRFDEEAGAPESASPKPEQEQPQRRGSRGWNLSPAVGQLRPQNRHDRAHPDFSAKKEVALKMKRPRENGRTPSAALGSWTDDMEDETEGEMMVSDYAKPGIVGKTVLRKKAVRMSVGLRPYPARVTSLEKVQKVVTGIDGEEPPAACAVVSRTKPALPMLEQEDLLSGQRESSALAGLLADLKALGLNPFHGESAGIPDAVSRSILLFRSRVSGRSTPRKQSSPPGEPNVNASAKTTKRPFKNAAKQGVPEAIRVATVHVPQPLSPLVSEEAKKGFDEDLGKKLGVLERADGLDMGAKKLKTKQLVGLLDGISAGTMAEAKEAQPPVSEEPKGFDEDVGEKLGVWERAEGQEMGAKKLKTKRLVNYAAKRGLLNRISAAAMAEPNEAELLSASVLEEPNTEGVGKKLAARERAEWQEGMGVAKKLMKKMKPPINEGSEQGGFRDDIGLFTTPEPAKVAHTRQLAPVSEEPKMGFEENVGNKRTARERVDIQEEKVAAKKAKIVAQMKALAAARRHQAPPESRKVCVLLDDTPPPQPPESMYAKSLLEEEKKTAPPRSSPTPRELKIAAALAAAMKAEAPTTDTTKPERRVPSMKAEGPTEMMKPERRVPLMKTEGRRETTKPARLVSAMKLGGPRETTKPARLLPAMKAGGPTETTKLMEAGGPTETRKPSLFVAAAQQVETPPRPTYLVLRFPPGSTLPSVPSLKARLARFGPLDPSRCRVTWRTRTCQVLFRRRADAARACKHISSAEGTGRMFGPVKLACGLVEANPPPVKSASDLVEEADPPPGFEEATPPPSQLKSCLKQPTSPSPVEDEQQRGGGGMRVKFVQEEDGGNVKKMACAPFGNGHGKVDDAPAATPWDAWEEVKVDRASDVCEQMMKLLWKCHGVVDGIRDARGYLPYHTL